jgi:hypothetical protein
MASNQRCIIEFDCDSGYFGDHKFDKLVDGCGTECMFSLDSLLDRWKASTGFRFGVDTDSLVERPIYYKSYKAKKINLESLPNIKLAVCNLKGLFGYSMAIYVSYIGASFIRRSNMFRNEELAVVTAGMNLIKHMLTLDLGLSSRIRHAVGKLPTFESKSGKREIDSCKVNCKHVLNQPNMKLFASLFQEALDLLGSPEGDELWRTEYVGMAFEEPLVEKLNFEEVKEFLEDFKHNHYFTANAAGFKEIFQNRNISIKIRSQGLILDDVYPLVEEKIQEIYTILREELFVGADFGSIYYFFDIASNLIPNEGNNFSFLLNTKVMKPCMVRYLNKR